MSVLEDIGKLPSATGDSSQILVPVYDRSMGAGKEVGQLTLQEAYEKATAVSGLKAHELGEDNAVTGNYSQTNGLNNRTGGKAYPYTCTPGGTTVVVAGEDVTSQFPVDTVIRLTTSAAYQTYRVVGISFSTNTTITLDGTTPNATTGTIANMDLGNSSNNTGMNNVVEGNAADATGYGLTITKNGFGGRASGGGGVVDSEAGQVAGFAGKTRWPGEWVLGGRKTAAAGDTQSGKVIVKVNTTDATPSQLLADGLRLILPTKCAVYFKAKIVAIQTGGVAGTAGDAYTSVQEGLITRMSSDTTAIDVTEAYTDGSVAFGGSAVVAADDTNEALIITATGEADKNIRWVAEVEYVMVSFT